MLEGIELQQPKFSARSKPATDEFDLDPPFLRLCSEQPNVPIQNVDVTRRPLAFGRCALPKLVNLCNFLEFIIKLHKF